MDEEFALKDPTQWFDWASEFAHHPAVQNETSTKDLLDCFPLLVIISSLQTKVQDGVPVKRDEVEKEAAANEFESLNVHGELELDSNNDNITPSKSSRQRLRQMLFQAAYNR